MDKNRVVHSKLQISQSQQHYQLESTTSINSSFPSAIQRLFFLIGCKCSPFTKKKSIVQIYHGIATVKTDTSARAKEV